MSWGDVIRSTSATAPSGIGGDENTIWYCGDPSDRVYERSTADLSVIRRQYSPKSHPTGIGGNASTIWHCDGWNQRLYELDPSDFSVMHIQIPPNNTSTGIGGDTEYIWHCDDNDNIYELNTNLSIISSVSSPDSSPNGIGGAYNKIWHTDRDTDDIYELASDLSVLRHKSIYSYGCAPSGIGGNANVLWSCASNCDLVLERSVGTPVSYVIYGNVKDYNGNNINDASIEIKNGTDYSALTNTNGNYLQTITPDTYNVTASKKGYPPQHASVNATSSDQIRNFTLSCIERQLADPRTTVQREIATDRKLSPSRLKGNIC